MRPPLHQHPQSEGQDEERQELGGTHDRQLGRLDSAWLSRDFRALWRASAAWTSLGEGVPGLVGQLLSTVLAAESTGHWSRLKACSNDSCQWAFYDHSRSRTGRWCSMQICGNRAKQQRFHRGKDSSEAEDRRSNDGRTRGR
ncbi:MAG TPA: CGNR zinc finger domain-containing protein [Propionibacteriaceae bacterium]|nr:CGNR zinc finger domain-containing protein [Propionibacteriaceae bacterium]